jgi:tetratricopeptide (TPR) repeat protein
MGALLVAALAAALIVEGGRWGWQRERLSRARRELFESALRDGLRPYDVRLSHPLLERYRPPRVRCGDFAASVLERYGDLSLLAAGDLHGLATVHAIACDPQKALRMLDELPPSPGVISDIAGLLLARQDDHAEALARLDQVLRDHPTHPQALWNRALVLAALDLPRAAARAFRAVADLGEPGWSGEAAARADRLEAVTAARLRDHRQALASAAGVAEGHAPPAEVIAAFPDLVRVGLYRAAARLPPEGRGALLPAAKAIDERHGGSSLEALARGAGDPEQMEALLEPPLTLDKAQRYQHLAALTGDPWQEIEGWQLVGRAEADARRFEPALVAFDHALALCRREDRPFPLVCAETKIALARAHGDRYQLQVAYRLALAAKRECQLRSLPDCELRANGQLQRIESVRTRRGLSRAYAEENSLDDESCEGAQFAHEQLAELAQGEGNDAETRRQLAAVRPCPGGAPRFGRVGVGVLADLVRDPASHTETELGWFRESLAAHQAGRVHAGLLELGRFQLYEGRGLIEREPARAQAVLERVIAQCEAAGPGDDGRETLRMQAFSTLIMGAARRGDHQGALELLARALRVTVPSACVVGAWGRSTHRVYIARGPRPPTVGAYRGDVVAPAFSPHPTADDGEPPLPPAIQRAVEGCARVDVLATRPILGRARLLPDHLAWGYLRGRGGSGSPAAADGGSFRRLVVDGVDVPESLGLPRLQHHPPAPALAGQVLDTLRGAEATPDQLLERLPAADVVELHVHGIFDPSISDAPVLVLSPDPSGRTLLSARDVEKLRLQRRPVVILGACDVAQSARYWSFQHSLPESFLRAGARWVLASPAPVDDSEAGPFFESVWKRTADGVDVALALRDERQSARWRSAGSDWFRQVVAFYDEPRPKE